MRRAAHEPGPQTAPCSPGLLWGTVIRPPWLGRKWAVSYVCERGVLTHALAALSDARQGGVQPPCGRTPRSQTFRNSPFLRWPRRTDNRAPKEPRTAGRCLRAGFMGRTAHRLPASRKAADELLQRHNDFCPHPATRLRLQAIYGILTVS